MVGVLLGTFEKEVSALPDGRRLERHRLDAMLDACCRLDGRERLLLSRDGKLLAASDGAPALLDGRGRVCAEGGRLRGRTRNDGAELARLLRAGKNEVLTTLLDGGVRGAHLVVRATGFGDEGVCVSIQPASDDFALDLPDLSRAFGLTPSECTIIVGLFNGQTPQQIAQDQRISINTVRAHLRNSYGKLGVSCREELWRKLNAYSSKSFSTDAVR